MKIAAELEIKQCIVNMELKGDQETDGAGAVVLDGNFQPAYSAWTIVNKADKRNYRQLERISA